MERKISDLTQEQINEEYASLVNVIESTWKEYEEKGIDLVKKAASKTAEVPISQRKFSSHRGIPTETLTLDKFHFIHIIYDKDSVDGLQKNIRIDDKGNILGVLAVVDTDIGNVHRLLSHYDASRFWTYGNDLLHVDIVKGKIRMVQRKTVRDSVAVQNYNGKLVLSKSNYIYKEAGTGKEVVNLTLNYKIRKIKAQEYCQIHNLLSQIDVGGITRYRINEEGNITKEESRDSNKYLRAKLYSQIIQPNHKYALELIRLGEEALQRPLLEKIRGIIPSIKF